MCLRKGGGFSVLTGPGAFANVCDRLRVRCPQVTTMAASDIPADADADADAQADDAGDGAAVDFSDLEARFEALRRSS